MTRCRICILTLFIAAAAARGDEVFQFRGPNGLGVSQEKGLPTHWNEKQNVRWRAPLPGRGLSNPVIAGGRVFVTAASGFEQKRLHVLCLDLATGKTIWHRQLWATGHTQSHPKTNMAAPTPVTDGRHVWALFATCDLVCFDLDGNLVWYRSLAGDYPTIGNNVGLAASPTLWRDRLVVFMESVGESFVAGLDAHTGENRWRLPRPRNINWITPLVISHAGRAQVLVQGGDGLFAHDPAGGEKIWEITGNGFHTITSATFADGLVFASSGPDLWALRPGSDKEKPQIVWKSKKHPTGYSSPTVYQGRVYTVGYQGALNCSDAATGQHIWAQRLEGKFAASPLAADGKLYLASEEGSVAVVAAGVEPKILAVNQLPETFLATPVAADGAVFLRSDQNLYCIGQKK